MWVWLFRMLRNCTSARYAINKARMVPLAEYSRDCLRALAGIDRHPYDERSQGTLQLFRTQTQLDGTGGDIEVLKQFGVPFELLDPAGCIAAEPALARVREKYQGRAEAARRRNRRLPAVHDAAGRNLQGARRRVPVSAPRPATSPATEPTRMSSRSKINGEKVKADAYVMALGSYSARWMRKRHVSDPGLSGQGLFDHAAGRRCRRRAGLDGHGRNLQGCHHPARRPHPGRRHRRNLRLRPDAARVAARDAGTLGQRPVSRRGATRPRRPSGAACGR